MKGKRTLLFQFNGLEFDYAALKKAVDKELKAKGIKGTDEVIMYFKDNIFYCVVNGINTVEVKLC